MTARSRLIRWTTIDDALRAGAAVPAGDVAWHEDYRWSRQMADDAAAYSAEYGLARDWMFNGYAVRPSCDAALAASRSRTLADGVGEALRSGLARPFDGAAVQPASARRRQCGVPHEQSVPVTKSTPPMHADAWGAAHLPAAGKRHLLQWWVSVRVAATRLLISLARAVPTARAPFWRAMHV